MKKIYNDKHEELTCIPECQVTCHMYLMDPA